MVLQKSSNCRNQALKKTFYAEQWFIFHFPINNARGEILHFTFERREAKAYSEPCGTSKRERIAKIVKTFCENS